MEDFITDWETNEKLSIKQREKHRQLEEQYLRDRFSKREKTVDYDTTLEKAHYLMIDKCLYKVENEVGFKTYVSRNNETLVVNTSDIDKKEGSIVWHLAF